MSLSPPCSGLVLATGSIYGSELLFASGAISESADSAPLLVSGSVSEIPVMDRLTQHL